MTPRLSPSTKPIGRSIAVPGYAPEAHRVGIVHLGVGAFHKAHQAVYTDAALAAHGGDWRIRGVSLRSPEAAEALKPQGGRYTLLTRERGGTKARIIGSIADILVAPQDPEAVIAAIADPAVRIVTLTVTEKAYGLDPAGGGLDESHEAVRHDLSNPERPCGVLGFLVAGLARRMADEAGPLSIVSCDNLPHNGQVLGRLVTELAARTRPDLQRFIEKNVRFPSTMVDRITPAATNTTFRDAAELAGAQDRAAVETEPFTQWVIEDDFAGERPYWEAGGALFVTDVAPFEEMKLRMLNGAHSLIAYAGFGAGYGTVAEAMQDPALARLVERQMKAAAATLPDLPGIDLDGYRADLVARFSNPAIRHLTYQIAMDGTQKLPPRIFAALGKGADSAPFAFAVASWMHYCLGQRADGSRYNLRDPREDEIASRLSSVGQTAEAVFDALATLPGFMPSGIRTDLRSTVLPHLTIMLTQGTKAAIQSAADGMRP